MKKNKIINLNSTDSAVDIKLNNGITLSLSFNNDQVNLHFNGIANSVVESSLYIEQLHLRHPNLYLPNSFNINYKPNVDK